MDLASAVQFLIGYEVSLKLAPGQKPPPPSASLFAQLSEAVRAIEQELTRKEPSLQFSALPPSVWSDWPLCCGVDLTVAELQAARSFPPCALRDRGLLSLFLALHSCAERGIDGTSSLASNILDSLALKESDPEEDDSATFPSVHLAARVVHRLINADDTLDFRTDGGSVDSFTLWERYIRVPFDIISKAESSSFFDDVMHTVPHEAAGISLAKEMAAILGALCSIQQGSEGPISNRLPFVIRCCVLSSLDRFLKSLQDTLATNFRNDVYREAAALPVYSPVRLLQSFTHSIDAGLGCWPLSRNKWTEDLDFHRYFLWNPLTYNAPLSRLRPAEGYIAVRLGFEDLMHLRLSDDASCSTRRTYMYFTLSGFACHALQSGLVQPELILRARPQLLEGLVEGLARGQFRRKDDLNGALNLVALLTRSPAVGFHLRKFFRCSGCLQSVLQISDPKDCRKELIRLLGPRYAQSVATPLMKMPDLLELISESRDHIKATTRIIGSWVPARICDFITRDLTLDMLREPSHPQPILQYFLELMDEISQRPRFQHGPLFILGLGKACLTLSNIVARAQKDIREAGPKGKGVRGSRGATGPRGAGIEQLIWRDQLADMGRHLFMLRRRVLRELLPLAEAREAALWEVVREEEVVAALTEGPGARTQ